MKINLYPKNNKKNFWIGIFLLVLSIYVFGISNGDLIGIGIGAFNFIVGLFNILYAYFEQGKTETTPDDDYNLVLQSIENTSETLLKLKEFLQQEKERVVKNKKEIKELLNERKKIAPLLSSEKRDVEAILNAYYNKTKSNVWKERIIGFSIGILSSTMAALLYDLIIN